MRHYLGSQAAIMFLASNICWVSSGTVRALGVRVGCLDWRKSNAFTPYYTANTSTHLYCWLPLAVSGAKPGMKKCSLRRR